jgi:hypothetical protein
VVVVALQVTFETCGWLVAGFHNLVEDIFLEEQKLAVQVKLQMVT